MVVDLNVLGLPHLVMLVQFLLPGFGSLSKHQAQEGNLMQFNYASCHCTNSYLVHRWVDILMPEVPEEEVMERIISDQRGEELLGAAVAEHGKGAVLAAVHEIQGREVERSLLEVHQVFLDMAVMAVKDIIGLFFASESEM